MYEPQLEKKTISEVLQMNFGNYFLPSIQRDFVWDEDDIKEMIDSLLNGYPVGIITIFKTDLEFPATPLIDSSNENVKEKFYILDGQQRLTSLLLLREKWKLRRNGETIERTPIYYNPDGRKLRIKGKNTSGIDLAKLVNMAIFRESPDPSLQNALRYIKENFLDRPIAFYIVEVRKKGKSEEEIYNDMAQIFTRINRAGIKLGNLEMFLSFFASASIGKDEIVNLHKDLNKKYSMDLEPVIRFVFSNLGITQHQISKIDSFKKAIGDIKKRYKEEGIKSMIEKSKRAILTTMDLLKSELGISTVQILPSETVLVPLFKYIYNRKVSSFKNLSDKEKKHAIKWFILASFHGLYSSQTDARLESDLEIIKEATESFPLKKMLNSMEEKIKTTKIDEKDFKNIQINILRGTAGKKYLFILYILLAKNKATDWAGHLITERSISEIAKHHLFPKDQLKETQDEIAINHIGNLTFIDKGENEELQNELPEEYFQKYNEKVLKMHFIPSKRELWKIEKYSDFLKERTELMWKKFCEFMKELGKE
jgi:hypothetical protein